MKEKVGREKIKFKIELKQYLHFMTYSRLHERGGKGITKKYTRLQFAKRRMGQMQIDDMKFPNVRGKNITL